MTLRRMCVFMLLAYPAWPAQAEDCNNNQIPDDQDIANCNPEIDPGCGDCVPHNCCEVSWLPGCTDETIEYCVCITHYDEYGWGWCGDFDRWDTYCVGHAENDCGAICTGNGIPDECDIESGYSSDCNGNGVPDECDIGSQRSMDRCPSNGIPDECEDDCNCNGNPDDDDIASAVSADCEPNGVPDECGCPVDLVLVVDTSASMDDDLAGTGELDNICAAVQDALDELVDLYIPARVTVLGMAEDVPDFYWCTLEPRKERLGTYLQMVNPSFDGTVPGQPPLLCGDELSRNDERTTLFSIGDRWLQNSCRCRNVSSYKDL